MSMSQVIFGAIMPHPPLLVPAVGGNKLKEIEKTKKSAEEIARRLKTKNFDTLVVITPHGTVSQATVPLYTSPVFEGDLSAFGAKANYHFKGDPELAIACAKESPGLTSRTPETILDHGALVPLHYIAAAGIKKPVMPVAIAFLPLRELYKFGKVLAAAAKKLNRLVAVIASADMSHKLTPDAPSGFDPKGAEFDKKLVELVSNYDVNGILDFPPTLADKAGQDALWSIAILLGMLDGIKVKQEVLSYEGPFGVGYMVAALEPIS